MKTSILTTVAAALIAGVAGLTLATTASAGVPKKLKLAGACASVNGGNYNRFNAMDFSGWKTGLCLLHTISTQNTKLGWGATTRANFKKYVRLPANRLNLARCAKSLVLLRLYKRTGGGNWKLVLKTKGKAYPKISTSGYITGCEAVVVTGYYTGGNQYRTLVMAIDGDGKNKGNLIASWIHGY